MYDDRHGSSSSELKLYSGLVLPSRLEPLVIKPEPRDLSTKPANTEFTVNLGSKRVMMST